MSDYPEVVYWLTLINESNLKLNIVKPVIQRWCIVEQQPLSRLFDLSPLEWSTTFGLTDNDAEKAASARDQLAQQAAALARWQSRGLEPLIRTDPRYPTRLAQTLPAAKQPLLLWVQGLPELLNESAVAMLGREAPDDTTARFLDELMKSLVSEDISLVSGYGRGLDRMSFEMMLNTAGGRAVVLLPMGLNAFTKTTGKLETAVKTKPIALASPFGPDTPYEEKFAEARNLLIDHLALALLVLDTDDDAIVRAGAALDRGVPVFVSLTDTASNRALIDQGALLLTDPGEVVEMVQQAVIDAVLQESSTEEEQAESAVKEFSPPVMPPETDPGDDYGLRSEELDPIDSDEALEILSMGGEIPEVLRQRLNKAANQQDE